MSSFELSIEDLPGNVMTDIISRLPVKKIIHCKCVCKNWEKLVSDSYFINIHLSRSPTGVVLHHNIKPETRFDSYFDPQEPFFRSEEPGILKWVEFTGESDDTPLHQDGLTDFDLNLAPIFKKSMLMQVGSVNGLLCMWLYCPMDDTHLNQDHFMSQYVPNGDNTYICNPITREYMILPRPKYYRETYATIVYGFGVGLLTKEYKVIRIFQGDWRHPGDATTSIRPHLLEAEVYTLGTGHWRQLGHVTYWLREFHGPYLNGCVHWFVREHNSPEKIYAFDFDDETFHFFPSPPSEDHIRFDSLGVLNDCLCQSHSSNNEFTIWVMKEYGIKKSWHKEVVIKESIRSNFDWLMSRPVTLLKGLEDGTILLIFKEDRLLVYCPRKKTIEEEEFFGPYFTGMAYRPSFLKLQDFQSEIVHVL